MARGHAGVAIHFALVLETRSLPFACLDDAFADDCGGLLGAFAGHVAIFHSWHFDVQVDAVEERAGYALSIALHLQRSAAAFAFEVAEVAAWAGVHRRYQHE